ncbi:CocE/NonD family hydrolase [Sphingomonas psychrotolerans]|uniref:X-Pro dipeptidyl-peptidase n=1 Tax=Sphingomonas psychrotolerans TaxID=1327635 RepID=A0A2K8MFR1_9SPHN|nr:CocE/NonD family hydrolase [Sphingomonas psychrotolerans]ATY32732.1 X-Pro dipeptidyl-peptidase [Sphingomonas psychrotolerans]
MRGLAGFVALAALAVPLASASSQTAPRSALSSVLDSAFSYEEMMVPMRDGAKLQTVILRPKGKSGKLPILLQRTPYGVPDKAPSSVPASMRFLMEDGYILVFQNMRGQFKSDGDFTMSMALDAKGRNGVDEATDAWDSVDWLVKNVSGNNGKVGMWGVSYPGYASAVALARPHPALKAVSPQAAWNDWWINDDLHRYGAMRLSYATDWLFSLQNNDSGEDFDYGGKAPVDSYDWFLKLGPVANLDKLYFKGSVPQLTAMIEHPDYDDFWKRQRWTETLGRTAVPTLHVAGFWDQEDPLGTWKIYEKMEAQDPDGLNMIVAGPWAHGTWHSPGSDVGYVKFGKESGTDFMRDIEAPFFAHWLHGKGAKPAFEARMFQSGSWEWKSYARWPAPGATMTNLYLQSDGTLSFTAPADPGQCREYVSDPANPVPFRERPISRTYPSQEWRWWEAADQRFVDHRPDVLSYSSAPLEADLTVTGEVAAKLMASTSGTDSDFVVKLIDVLPDDYEPVRGALGDYPRTMNGYQFPIAMEIRRGRYLQSFEKATPLTPNQVVAWDVPLRSHDHVFKKGHRIMVQVQSSWFPVIDRNPQKFVPNIYKAAPEDFVKATQRVCSGSLVALPVIR